LNTLVNFESAQPSKNGQFSVGVNIPEFLIDAPTQSYTKKLIEAMPQIGTPWPELLAFEQ